MRCRGRVCGRRPAAWPAPAALGLLASASLVVAASRTALPAGVQLGPGFFGLLQPSRSGGTGPAAAVVLALAVLVGCWWSLLRHVAAGRLGARAVLLVAVLWAVPLLPAPALLSLDAYSYLAQGRMLVAGLDPYAGGPVLLGGVPAGWTDPIWRSSPVPYGPVALLLLRAVAVVAPEPTSGVLLLRLLALLGVLAAAAAALPLTAPARRAHLLALVLLNPVTLVHLIGGAHLDAVLAGIVGLTVLALHRGRLRLAWLLAGTALAVKVTVAPLLAFVAVELARRGRWRTPAGLLQVGLLAATPYLLAAAAVSRPWGFLATLGTPGSVAPWYAPATVVSTLVTTATRLAGFQTSPDPVREVTRWGLLAAGAVAVVLLLRADRAEHAKTAAELAGLRSRSAGRIALALLTVAFCLPALYAWYLGPAMATMAAVASRRWTSVLVAASSALAFGSLPPLFGVDRLWFAAAAAAAVLGLLGHLGRLRRPDTRPATPGSRRGASGAAPVGDRRGRHASRTAELAGAALLGAAVIGLLVEPAGAEASLPAPTQTARQLAGRTAVVEQLRRQYPRLHLLTLQDAGRARLLALLVGADGSQCEVLLEPGASSRATAARLSVSGAGRTPRAIDELACPPPQGAPADRSPTVSPARRQLQREDRAGAAVVALAHGQ